MGAIILGGIYVKSLDGDVFVVNNTATTTVEKLVEPDWATDQEAVEAAKAVIRRKELEAEEKRLEGEIEALRASLVEVQKELGTF